jgi:hypothetical protein
MISSTPFSEELYVHKVGKECWHYELERLWSHLYSLTLIFETSL